MSTPNRWLSGVSIVLLALGQQAGAQTWTEVGDAPDVIPGQSTSGSGSFTTIDGTINNVDLDADVYCIQITNGTSFSATVGLTTLDTTNLFLFDSAGNGVGHSGGDDFFDNTNSSGQTWQGVLTTADVGILATGTYYLAISHSGNDALNGLNQMWNDFAQGSPGSVGAANGPGAPGPQTGFTFGGWGQGSTYTIALTGTEFCGGGSTACPLPAIPDICDPRVLLGDCQNGGPTDLCRPTQMVQDASGQLTATKCECLNPDECFITEGHPGVLICQGVICPQNPSLQCPATPTATTTGGSITYECCPTPTPQCDLPALQDIDCGPRLLLGDCQNGAPTDLCLPTMVVQDASGHFTATKCECLNPDECFLALDPHGVLFCQGLICPNVVGLQCPMTPTATTTGGSIAYECCPTPTPKCDLPPHQDIDCGPRMLLGDCDGSSPDLCLATSVHVDDSGAITATVCECLPNIDSCHVVLDPLGLPHCDMVCPTGKPCRETVEPDNGGGYTLTCCCPGSDLVVDLTTGVDDVTQAPIPFGVDDDTWTVTCEVTPNGPLPRPATVVNRTIIGVWADLSPPSEWISANFFGPNGDYCYETCFCLKDGFQNAELNITMLADDGADVNLLSNLASCQLNLTQPQPPNFVSPTTYSFQLQSPCVAPGKNCIEVVVHNLGGPPTGFEMTGQFTADDAECCPCPLEDPTPADPCASLQKEDCMMSNNDDLTCRPTCVKIASVGGVHYPSATECACAEPNCCGSVEIIPLGNGDTGLTCLGACVPAVCPATGGQCEVIINGVSHGQVSVLASGLAVGDEVCCECVPFNCDDDICDDHNACTVDRCDPATGCDNSEAVVCDDHNACTVNRCIPAIGCDYLLAVVCDDGKFCTGVETCDAMTGCQDGPNPTCNDNIFCTMDSCNTTTDSCQNLPNHSACNDGLYCTGVEKCLRGVGCRSSVPPCGGRMNCIEETDTCTGGPDPSERGGGRAGPK